MSSSSAPAARYCPRCGRNTSALACPNDGAPTFARDGSSAGALNYSEGKIVTGKYKIGRRLGRGGFGAVYAAENLTTAHNVAIKVLAIDPDDADDSMIQRFLQEAQVTARLKHPNTIRVFDFGQTDEGALFMVMEMLNGPTLEQLLKDNEKNGVTMSEKETLGIAIPILRSLAEAHDNALVHRDLKPLNVMLTEASDDDRIVKVLDFGIARKQDSQLTGTGKALGTPSYMSPEQCKGGNLDGRSDLYALGIIMFRCVAGRLPFATDNQLALLQAQINEPVPNVRTLSKQVLSDGFVACLERALQKDPRLRFENAKAMRQELESILGGAWAGTPIHAMDALPDEPEMTRVLEIDATRAVVPAGAESHSQHVPAAKPTSDAAGTQVLDISVTTPDRAASASPPGAPGDSKTTANAAEPTRSRVMPLLAAVVVVVAVAAWLLTRSGGQGAAVPSDPTEPAAVAAPPAPSERVRAAMPAPAEPRRAEPAPFVPEPAPVAAVPAPIVAAPAVVPAEPKVEAPPVAQPVAHKPRKASSGGSHVHGIE